MITTWSTVCCDLGEHVARDEDRLALGREAAHEVAQPAHALRVEPVRGLVEDQQLRVAEQRAREAEPLPHPERVAADAAAAGRRRARPGRAPRRHASRAARSRPRNQLSPSASRPSASASENRWSRPERPGWKSAASSTAPTRPPAARDPGSGGRRRAPARRSAGRGGAASAASSSCRRRSGRGSRSPSRARARTTDRRPRARRRTACVRCSARTTGAVSDGQPRPAARRCDGKSSCGHRCLLQCEGSVRCGRWMRGHAPPEPATTSASSRDHERDRPVQPPLVLPYSR